MVIGSQAFRTLLLELAALWDQENRAGGDAAASALRQAAAMAPAEMPRGALVLGDELAAVMAMDPHPVVDVIRTAMPCIDWFFAALGDNRIRPDIASRMAMCELVGPDGMILDDTVRVGLWMQSAGLVYGPRSHAAEETFLILAGAAEWSAGGREPEVLGSGAVVHHAAYIHHTSVTRDKPVLVAWRWSGEIGFDKYMMKD